MYIKLILYIVTVNFKIYNYEKSIFLLVMSVFMCTTCTVNDEVQNSVPTSRSIELQKVVGKLEKMNSQIPETRGFRDWFKRVFYSDACGYAWEEDVGGHGKEYVIQIDYLDDNVSIDEFTERLNQEINNLDLTPEDVEYLQTILSVAKNSHKLWTEIQK